MIGYASLSFWILLKPIVLTPEEHARLNELRKGIDPEVLKRIDVLADAE